MTRHLLTLAAVALLTAPVAAQKVYVTGGTYDLKNVVVTFPKPANGVSGSWERKLEVPIQAGRPSLLSTYEGNEVTFLLQALKAGETTSIAESSVRKDVPRFRFVEKPGEYVDLLFDDRPVLRYMNAPRDGSSKEAHELTFKPYHHVFDPQTGQTLLTSGAGLAADKSLLFPHHRGLFYGWNRISYNGHQADTWHGRNGEYTLHREILLSETGPVYGRQRAKLSWHGRDGKPFADEIREVTAYNVPGGTLIDFASVLTTELAKVRLDGDPQHAGFHFRAAQEVAKNGKENTYYLRPDGKGKIGETRNWDPKTGKGPVNQPWNAMSFVIGGTRYTVLRMTHSDNPGEARGSERDYGRFGDYFEYDLTPQTPLKVRYRIWVQEGEMTGEECENIYRSFVNPPEVTVK
jgi:hypothetical protein